MKIEERDFIRIKEYMLSNYGINLENKSTLIEGRLSQIVMKEGFESFRDYTDAILKHPGSDMLQTMVSKLTTNYTYFMREPQHFDFMTANALPTLEPIIKNRTLQLWSAGCSSGEEPYTAAIVLKNYFKLGSSQRFNITATDISSTVLAQASAGVYSAESLKSIDQNAKRAYFTLLPSGSYQVGNELRSAIAFSRFNLMDDFSGIRNKYHIIFCRNVMIYFNQATRANIVRKFYDALEPGGYLFVGLSETLSNVDNRFQYIKPSIYRKGLS